VFTFGAPVMVETPATGAAIPALARRYGTSEADFITMATSGQGMMSAELCAAGLVGAIVHASEFAGRETSAAVGLARIGLVPSGEPPVTAAESSLAQPGYGEPPQPPADVILRATAVEGVIGSVREELDSLGVFQRQWYRRTFTHGTGLDFDEWTRTAHDAVSRLRQGRPVEPLFVERLQRLAAFFAKQEADLRGYVSDPVKLEQGLAELRRRRAAVDSLLDALAGTPATR
jgi:hypothetical protein